MIDKDTPVTITLTQRQAILLYFKSEWILSSGTVEENNKLARDILAQINPQLHNQPAMQKIAEARLHLWEDTSSK